MGRVHEARRRAAIEQRTDTLAVVPMPHPPEAVDFTALVSEAFGDELPDWGESEGQDPNRGEAERVLQDAVLHVPVPVETATRVQAIEAEAFHAPSDTWLESLDAELSHKVMGAAHMSPISREQYRQLAATLHNAQVSNRVQVIMIASAIAGEGKTLTAANLALTLSESYHRRVLLVDADLRRPTLDLLFGHTASTVSERLPSPDQHVFPVRQVTARLGIMTIESPSSAPMAELTSERMQHLVRKARASFDWVVIDTPAVVLLPDATLLASMVDGVVLVVKAESTPYDLVQQAVEALGRKKMLGLVLNASRTLPSTHDYEDGEAPPLAPTDGPGNGS